MTAVDGPGGEERLRRKAKTEDAGSDQQGGTALGPSKEMVGSKTRAGRGENRLRRVATGGSDGGGPRDGSALGPHLMVISSKTRAGKVRLRRKATGRGGVARGRREKRGLRLAGNEVNKINRAGGVSGACGSPASWGQLEGSRLERATPSRDRPWGVVERRGPGRGTEVVWGPPWRR